MEGAAAMHSNSPRPTSQRRVLVEHRDDAARDVMERVLTNAGYEVVSCSGPDGLVKKRCPLVCGTGCELCNVVDVVVHSLTLGAEQNRDVLAALRSEYSGVPIVVEATSKQAAEHAELLEGCTRLDYPCTRATLTAAVEHALVAR